MTGKLGEGCYDRLSSVVCVESFENEVYAGYTVLVLYGEGVTDALCVTANVRLHKVTVTNNNVNIYEKGYMDYINAKDANGNPKYPPYYTFNT